ncbi:hypothetical protein QJS10_CPB18g00635 [Acorus calamus]|uniref:SGF29 C-terminal domain-containing protein n=1 Tax=Acorus calamus TaxID=4465 RepID=A0AAV9CMZ6_ACOCL|nr:hypothetical protein QJS10_CPB18g00635 [Acorus calamus]
MSSSSSSAAAMDVGGIFEHSKELDRLRKEQDVVLSEINRIHKKLQSTPEMVEKSGDNLLSRLRTLYVQAKDLAENEMNTSNMLVGQLDTLLQPGLPAVPAAQRKKIEVSEQKKKRVKADSEIPRLSPAASIRIQLDNAASLKGERVAARVRADDAEKDEWLVVKVIHFDRETKEFEVLDEDEDEGNVQRKYKLPMSRIIPFPKRGEPSSAQDFPLGSHVLAVYPTTTALYKATVVNPHRKRKTDDYLLEFDDDEGDDGCLPQRAVPFDEVVALPEGYRQ